MRDIITQNKLKTEKALMQAFVGQVVNSVRYMTASETTACYWSNSAPVITFTNGSYILPTTDDEGNNAGGFITSLPHQETANAMPLRLLKTKDCLDVTLNLKRALQGKKVHSVRYIMPSQAVHLGWSRVSVIITFEGGEYLLASSSDMSNAGGLHTSEDGIDAVGAYPIV
jgi:hypothetical protein